MLFRSAVVTVATLLGSTLTFGAPAVAEPDPVIATPSAALAEPDGRLHLVGPTGEHHRDEPVRLTAAVVGSASAGRLGWWLASADGGVATLGAARFLGSAGNLPLNQPVVGIAATRTAEGYWLVARDGGVFSFGDADFFGSTGGLRLNRPVVGMAATPAGAGYWLVAGDGGVYSFGDARYHGSTGAMRLNAPVVGMVPTLSGRGYWLAAADGGIFSFGDAPFLGSQPGSYIRSVAGDGAGGYALLHQDGRTTYFPATTPAGQAATRTAQVNRDSSGSGGARTESTSQHDESGQESGSEDGPGSGGGSGGDKTPEDESILPLPDSGSARTVVLAGSEPAAPNDRPLLERLTSLGLDVIVVDDDDLTPSSLDGASLLVVTSSVVPSKVPTWLASVPVPALVSEAYVHHTFLMAETAKEEASRTTVRIVDASHPLAASLNGDVAVQDEAPLGVGRPVPSATVVAADPATGMAALYGIDTGAALSSGFAPARRVGFFFSYDSPPLASVDAWDLFDAAVDWLAPQASVAKRPRERTTPVTTTTTLATTTTTLATTTTSTTAPASDPQPEPESTTTTVAVEPEPEPTTTTTTLAPTTTTTSTTVAPTTTTTSTTSTTVPSGLVWSSGFEELDWKVRWRLGMDSYPGNSSAVTSPTGSGRALRVFASGTNDGYTGMGALMRSRFRDLGIASSNEQVLRYSVYLPANWNPYAGGKLPGLAGITDGTTLGSTPGGGNYHEDGWSGRLMWRKPTDGNLDHTRLSTYLYVRSAAGKSIYDNRNPDNGKIYGIQIVFRRAPDYRHPWSTTQPLLHLRRGQWNTIELRYKMNTPGLNDGEFQGWLNGELGVDLRDVQYRTATRPGLNINELMFDTFYGGPTSNTTNQTWHFDDINIR